MKETQIVCPSGLVVKVREMTAIEARNLVNGLEPAINSVSRLVRNADVYDCDPIAYPAKMLAADAKYVCPSCGARIREYGDSRAYRPSMKENDHD